MRSSGPEPGGLVASPDGAGVPRGLRSKGDPSGGRFSNNIPQFALDFPRKESVCPGSTRMIRSTLVMFEILFLVFAVIALLRLPKDVRRMRERKRSASPSGAAYQMSAHAASRVPRPRPPPVAALTDIGSMSQW